jgi:parvulin-like peptidyl-prolyl isomerase
MKTAAYGKSLGGAKAVTEDQAKKFYDANVAKGMFNVPEQVHVLVILVKATDKDTEAVRSEAKKRAEEAAKRAAAGEDFAALAKEYSQDSSAARGGDLGLVPRGVMFANFEEVAFSAKPGTVSPLFETPKGFNVIKVLEKNPESTRTYEQVKSALMADMGRVMQQDIVKARVKELAALAKIVVLDPSFNPPAQAQLAVPPPAKP